MRPNNFITAIIITIILLCGSSSYASMSAKIHVTATVLPFVSFNAIQHIWTYRVDNNDISRGYIDIPNSITVNVRMNLNAGIPVIIEHPEGSRVLVRESGRVDFVTDTFTLNASDYSSNTPVRKNYDFRILLPADVKDGAYPLIITMAPAI